MLLQQGFHSHVFLNSTSTAGGTSLAYACLNGNTHAVRVSLCYVMSVGGHCFLAAGVMCVSMHECVCRIFWCCPRLFWPSMDMAKEKYEPKKDATVSSKYRSFAYLKAMPGSESKFLERCEQARPI